MEINVIKQMDCIEGLSQMKDNSVDYVLTSPPYNIKKSIKHNVDMYAHYEDNDKDYFNSMVKVINELLRVTKSCVFFNIQYVGNNKIDVFRLIGEFACNIKDILIWKKIRPPPAMNTNCLTHNYEFIIVLSKENTTRAYNIDFGNKGEYNTCFEADVNDFLNKERFGCNGNFAVMSKQVARHIIHTFTKEGDLILDPFMGSGTTAIICKELNRNYLGFEIIPEYIDIANKRLTQKIMKGFFETLTPSQSEGDIIAVKKQTAVMDK